MPFHKSLELVTHCEDRLRSQAREEAHLEEHDLAAGNPPSPLFLTIYSEPCACLVPILHPLKPKRGQHVLHSTQQMKKPRSGSWGTRWSHRARPSHSNPNTSSACWPASPDYHPPLPSCLPPYCQVLHLIKLAKPPLQPPWPARMPG